MPLALVATPIGNLDDLSPRARRTLEEADLVAAEDTRRAGKLLAELGLDKPKMAFYDAVEDQRTPAVLAALERGQRIALISDAGTPLVSDPGYRLVRAALDAGHEVIAIPGPSAVLTALVASGLPTDRFRFEGFVPRTDHKRRTLFETWRDQPATIIAFDSPARLLDTLAVLAATLGERPICVARELTKTHEELLRGSAADVAAALAARDRVRGEITLVVSGSTEPPSAEDADIARHVEVLQKAGLAPNAIRAAVAELLGVSKKRVFEVMTR